MAIRRFFFFLSFVLFLFIVFFLFFFVLTCSSRSEISPENLSGVSGQRVRIVEVDTRHTFLARLDCS